MASSFVLCNLIMNESKVDKLIGFHFIFWVAHQQLDGGYYDSI